MQSTDTPMWMADYWKSANSYGLENKYYQMIPIIDLTLLLIYYTTRYQLRIFFYTNFISIQLDQAAKSL